jgi:hypothetical protein
MHLKNLICSLFFSLALGLFALSTPTERIDLAERAPLSIVQITNNLLATVQQIKAGISEFWKHFAIKSIFNLLLSMQRFHRRLTRHPLFKPYLVPMPSKPFTSLWIDSCTD